MEKVVLLPVRPVYPTSTCDLSGQAAEGYAERQMMRMSNPSFRISTTCHPFGPDPSWPGLVENPPLSPSRKLEKVATSRSPTLDRRFNSNTITLSDENASGRPGPRAQASGMLQRRHRGTSMHQPRLLFPRPHTCPGETRGATPKHAPMKVRNGHSSRVFRLIGNPEKGAERGDRGACWRVG